MSCRHPFPGSSRLAAAIVAGGLALAACTSVGDATSNGVPPASDPAATSDNGSPSPSALPAPAEPTDEEAATADYEAFLRALATSMEAADPDHLDLVANAAGDGLTSAQAMVASLIDAGRVARGEFVPSIESIEIEDGVAEVRDCYRTDFVEFDANTDEQVADRDGGRFEATVQLERDDDGWVVTHFAQGDVCAPNDIAATVRDRYLAFWDAVWSAADPPDPDHPGLTDTAAGEHLDGLRAQLTRLREAGHVRRGRGTEHPVVIYVTAHDTQAVIRDCVEENPDGGIYDASSGERIEGGTAEGQTTLLEVRMEVINDAWRVISVRIVEEDSTCVPTDS